LYTTDRILYVKSFTTCNTHVTAPNDNQAYGVAGGLTEVRTPTLIELWETAPYFHNGSAETLFDVFDQGGVHAVDMVDTAVLNEFLNSIDRDLFIDDDELFSTP